MPGTEIASQFSFSSDFKHAAYGGEGANQYAEIYACDLPVMAPVKLTHAREQLNAFDTAKREVMRWKSGDGTVIEGILYKPADFDPNKKYPLLVVIHGGPTGIDRPVINADQYCPIEHFVAKGALILRPNYRGSAVDYLIGQGFVDKDRLGAMGVEQRRIHFGVYHNFERSVQGGFGRCGDLRLNDLLREYGHHAFCAAVSACHAVGGCGDLQEDVPDQLYCEGKTPTLIQHGGSDKRVPIANAFELRQALEDHGVPVKMVVYVGFGHPINKPKQQRAVMEENENWFNHYIWGDPLAASLTPIVKPVKP